MKVWIGYGSEHSNNLMMVGTFANVDRATEAFKDFDEIRKQAQLDYEDGILDFEKTHSRWSDAMRDLLMKHNVYSLGPDDLMDFVLDTQVSQEGDKIIVRTDEIEVAGFLKLFYSRGARIEVGDAQSFEKEAE